METPKPKPRRKRGCAREGCKRRPHELNRNAFALPPTRPVQHAAPLRRHQGRSSSPATSLRLVRGLQREWGVRAGAPLSGSTEVSGDMMTDGVRRASSLPLGRTTA